MKPEHCDRLEELHNARTVASQGQALAASGRYDAAFSRWDYLEAYCESINSAYWGE